MLVVHNAQRLSVVPVFDALRGRYGIDYAGVGTLFAAYVLGYAIFQKAVATGRERRAYRKEVATGRERRAYRYRKSPAQPARARMKGSRTRLLATRPNAITAIRTPQRSTPG